VLGDDAFVLQGHVPAGELRQASAETTMLLQQWRGALGHHASARKGGSEQGWIGLGSSLFGMSLRGVGLILQTVLEQEVHVVALVEDLALHVGIKLLKPAHLAVLLGDELLVERRDLYVEVELREIEIGREAVGHVAGAIPVDVERGRLVEPLDLVEIEQLGKLALAVVGELDARVGKGAVGAVRVSFSVYDAGDDSLSDS
jgi:hypothetical protein